MDATCYSGVVCHFVRDARESAVAACLKSYRITVGDFKRGASIIEAICKEAPHNPDTALLVFCSAWNWRWTEKYWSQLLQYYKCIYYVSWLCQSPCELARHPRVLLGGSVQLFDSFPELQLNERAVDLADRLQYADEWRQHARCGGTISNSMLPPNGVYIVPGLERMLQLQRSCRRSQKRTAYGIVKECLQSACKEDPFAYVIEHGKASPPSKKRKRGKKRRRRNKRARRHVKSSEVELLEHFAKSSAADFQAQCKRSSKVELLQKELQAQREIIESLKAQLEQLTSTTSSNTTNFLLPSVDSLLQSLNS